MEQNKLFVHYDNIERQNIMFRNMISEQLLKGNIVLNDIEQELRIKNINFYILSFRISRNSCKTLINDLKLLLSDICIINNLLDKKRLLDIFKLNYITLEKMYSGVKDFETFKETIPKEILQ